MRPAEPALLRACARPPRPSHVIQPPRPILQRALDIQKPLLCPCSQLSTAASTALTATPGNHSNTIPCPGHQTPFSARPPSHTPPPTTTRTPTRSFISSYPSLATATASHHSDPSPHFSPQQPTPTSSSPHHHHHQKQPEHHHTHRHSAPSFYHNHVLEQYASRETKRVTLRQLTVFGRTLTEDKVLRSANYVRTELPVRIAHRIVDFQHLPFIVGTNPHFELMYQLYWEAFEKFRSVPPVTTLEENRMFCDLMDRMLRTHLVAIPRLAMGITETSSHLDSRQADRFINVMLRSRIGRRVLAEQHIALSAHFDDMNGDHHENPYPYFVANHRKGHGYIGIVNTRCHAGETVERCTELASQLFRDAYDMEPPTVIVDGHLDATFTYIPDHLEYILYELLKNSMQFTIEKHAPGGLPKTPVREVLPYSIAEVVVARAKEMQKDSDGEDWRLSPYPYASPPPTSSSPQQREPQKQRQKSKGRIQHDLPPIRVTIGQGNNEIMFRVSDQGGGISRDLLADMWSFSLPAKKRRLLDFDKIPKLAAKVGEAIPPSLHLGLGLPMSRAYANYWGGTIDLHSMDGYGTDAYVKIATGNQMEHITYERSE